MRIADLLRNVREWEELHNAAIAEERRTREELHKRLGWLASYVTKSGDALLAAMEEGKPRNERSV